MLVDAGSAPFASDAGSSGDAGCGDGGCAESEPSPPRADAGAAESGKADAPDEREAPPPKPRPTRVLVDTVSFANGEVPRAQASLEKLAQQELSTCASQNGGVQGTGKVELKFLVRSRGRAEGVEVGRVQNVPPAVASCLAWTLARRPVGAPSDEPVFVTVTFKLIEEKTPAKGAKSVRAK